jgi:hypothetical protein
MRTATTLGIEWNVSVAYSDISYVVTVYEEDNLVPTVYYDIFDDRLEHRTIPGLVYRFTI